MEVRDTVQETGIKTIPMEKKCKKAKQLSEEALQMAVKRREAKGKGEKERYLQCCVSVYCTAEESVIRMQACLPFGAPSHAGHHRAFSGIPYALGSHLWEESEVHPHPIDN